MPAKPDVFPDPPNDAGAAPGAPEPVPAVAGPAPSTSWRSFVRPQDFVWLLLFSALAVFSPERSAVVIALLAALGVVQVLEPRIGPLASVVLKLGLCYVLIGYSGGVTSSFYLILLMPVISGATAFGLAGTAAVSLAACAVYLSFLVFLNEDQYIPEDQVLELVLRSIFLPVVAYLTHELAQANRKEAEKAQAAAVELARANRSLKEAEAQVRRAERLAALGQLTAGLAHELRNPMGTMKTSAELLARNVAAENAVAREMAGYIAEEVDRTNSLITRFLDFARPQRLKLEKGDLAAMLDGAIARFEREQSSAGRTDVTVFKNYSPDVPPLAFDAELMERVIVNLLTNAAQASPRGSVVTVKTHLHGDAMAEIDVIDRGSGIEPKNLENIFNPFFTTKADGVGFGLAIVAKIVDEHGGHIDVESAPGEGSVFRVQLPLKRE
ncbi:MAG TPA: ATP-binding protein [Bryobacteraceae bacterium]|nr:ATP-binding protein [Bryobacteraceae bacterium]